MVTNTTNLRYAQRQVHYNTRRFTKADVPQHDYEIVRLPKDSVVLGITCTIETAFTGNTNIDIGDTGDSDRYADNLNVGNKPALGAALPTQTVVNQPIGTRSFVVNELTVITARLAGAAAATAGEAHVTVCFVPPVDDKAEYYPPNTPLPARQF